MAIQTHRPLASQPSWEVTLLKIETFSLLSLIVKFNGLLAFTILQCVPVQELWLRYPNIVRGAAGRMTKYKSTENLSFCFKSFE